MKTKHTEAVTERFLSVMNDVIRNNIKSKGKIVDVNKFAESIGQHPQNFSKYKSHSQHVTLPIIEASCRVHKINPTFIILGIGEKFLFKGSNGTTDLSGKLFEHERRLRLLEKKLLK